MKTNEKGFGAVEGLLILIIIGLLGFIGWYVYHTKNNADSTYNSSATASQASKQSTASSSKVVDKEAIEQAVKSDCESTQGYTTTSVSVTKQEGNYASATEACGSTAYGYPTSRVYLKKSDNKWVIVVRGGGAPTTAQDLNPFGFPSDYLQ